jgi:hypothetical protein
MTVGVPFNYVGKASGSLPISYVASNQDLIPGVPFEDNGDGTYSLTGTPTTPTSGSQAMYVMAMNSAGQDSQSLVITVNPASATTPPPVTTTPPPGTPPSFSQGSVPLNMTIGVPFLYTGQASGNPLPSYTINGPSSGIPGVGWQDNLDGTFEFNGTPSAPVSGTWVVTASNSHGTAQQSFPVTASSGSTGTTQQPATTTAPPQPGGGAQTSVYVGPVGTFTVDVRDSSGIPLSVDNVKMVTNPDGSVTVTGTAPAGKKYIVNLGAI